MKKTLLALSLLGLAFTSHAAMVTFVGEVADESCSITINDNGTNPLVMLDTVPTSAFVGVGTNGIGKTDYTVKIFGCTSTPIQAGIKLGPNEVSSAGNLLNMEPTATAAVGVELQLLDLAGTAPLDFRGSNRIYALTQAWPAGATEMVMTLSAQYGQISAAVTPGRLISQVQYAATYK